nr:protein SPA1-related 4-like isoform X1 [Tanacetum cinerariifolium]
MQHRKQEAADSLRTTISVLTSDLEEVMKLQSSVNKKEVSSLNLDDCASSRSRKRIHQTSENQETSIFKSPRLMKNFKKLESAYFLTRQRAGKQSRWINSFMDGICKYLTYSKLKVKADLNQVDLLSSSNLVCSLSFDRDGEFFATAGVNKKIKVFEYDSILNGNHDIQYPVVEMGSGSKLSSICWNRYVKGQIASSNFDGVVQVWDVTRSQVFMEMREHERRAWSVDFSSADPKLLASGSDDGSVKLWNINQGVTVGTIKTKANVCCVQFPTDSGNSLTFGSADHRIYYYDLRNPSRPLCTFVGHDKTVSYVKFIDATTLVSSSTDNTLKLWDLSQCSSHVVGSPLQSFTGHTNVKKEDLIGLNTNNTNYTTWALMIETILKAYGLWKVIDAKKETDGKQETAIDEKAENTAKVMIFQTLPQDMLMQVAQYTTAKETLKSELETLKMKPNESENEFAGKLSSIQAKFKSLGGTLKDKILVRKLLNSVPKKFLPIVASIEQYQVIDTMQFEEAVGRITAFEERFKSQDEPEDNYQNKLLLASSNNQRGGRGYGRNLTKNKSSYEKGTSRGSIDKRKLRCYECGEHGHFAKECMKWKYNKDKQEESHLIYETDDEPTLL